MFRRFIACAILCVVAGPASLGQSRPGSVGPVAGYGRLPMTFEKNTGRYDKRVRFLARTAGGTLFLTDREAVLSLPVRDPQPAAKAEPRLGPAMGEMPEPTKPARRSVLRMKLAGSAGAASAVGLQKQQGIVNYFIGNDPKKWRTRVPTYARVKMAGVYPGIDLVYYGSPARALEYDFVVKPGSDPGRIRLAFSGARKLSLASNGDLIANTEAGDVRLKRPYAYQQVGGKRVQVACGYSLKAREVSVRVARYDVSRALVVDPVLVLNYATYLGGQSGEQPAGIKVDEAGFAMIVGTTWSPDFPTPGGYGSNPLAGNTDVFVARMNPTGTSQVYGTFLGGSGTDYGAGIAIGPGGSIVIAGDTNSPDLPTPGGAFTQPNLGGGTSTIDAFVLKLNAVGDELHYGTYVGGSSYDTAVGVAVDTDGCAYVAGTTQSTNFPTVAGSYKTAWTSRNSELFAFKLTSQGSGLVYATYIDLTGGYSLSEQVMSAMCLDDNRNVIMAGTRQDWDTMSMRIYAFAVGLNAAGTAIRWHARLGGETHAYGRAVAVDRTGAVYLAGYTKEQPVGLGPGAFSTYLGGSYDAFVLKCDTNGMVYGTYLGGSDLDQASGIAVGPDGKACVTGITLSPDLPVPGGTSHLPVGRYDGFVALLSASGDALQNATYLGGAYDDEHFVVDVDAIGGIYLAGRTTSSDLPTTPGAVQPTIKAGADTYIAKIRPTDPLPTTLVLADVVGKPGSSVVLDAQLVATAARWPVMGRRITFEVAGTPVGAEVTNEQGKAVFLLPLTDAMGVGALPVAAKFAGDADFAQAESTATLTVTPAPTFTYVVDRNGVISESVRLKAWLKRLTDNAWLPGRSLAFSIAGTQVGTASTDGSGMAYLDWVVSEAAGPRTMTVAFAGSAEYMASSGEAVLTVEPVHVTSLTVPDRAAELADYTLLKAYLCRDDQVPIEGKAVSFHVDGSTVGSATSNYQGRAMLEFTVPGSTAPGRHDLEARWAGNGGYLASSASAALWVAKAPSYLWLASRTIKQGGAAYLRSYLRRLPDYVWLPGKTVSYKLNGTALGTAVTDAGGCASLLHNAPPSMALGGHPMVATFPGDVTYLPNGSSGVLTVVP